MRKLSINFKKYNIPSKWNELSKNDLLEFCRILLLNVDEVYQRLMLLKYFTKLSFDAIEDLPTEAIPEIVELFDFLYEDSQLTINHFSELKKMVGPDNALTNLTFEEFFGQAEEFHFLIAKTKSSDHLNSLIDVLYKSENKNKSKIIENIDEPVKLAIYLFYQGSSNFIKHKFPEVFSSSKNIDNKKDDGLGFLRLVNSLNNSDMSKNEAIKKTNLYESLTYLSKILKENEQNN